MVNVTFSAILNLFLIVKPFSLYPSIQLISGMFRARSALLHRAEGATIRTPGKFIFPALRGYSYGQIICGLHLEIAHMPLVGEVRK